tara:strand:+ start:195 stop:1001 length:807 start_codon:yes stop_codon:yes gene_type:complete
MKILLLLFACELLLAWGKTGHRVVGEIAERNLEPEVQEKIRRVLDGGSLAEASTWADEIRSDSRYDGWGKFHYSNYFKNSRYQGKNKKAPYDIVSKMQEIETRWRGDELRAEDIRLYVHFMGDLHQPLHAGSAKDSGGNRCFVKWFGESTNLHRVWDEHLIDSQKLSFTEWSNFLLNRDLDKDSLQGDLVEWIEESHGYYPTVYPSAKKDAKGKDINYCVISSLSVPAEKYQPNLGYDYSYEHMPLVKRQLLLAGKRLAKKLNESLRD